MADPNVVPVLDDGRVRLRALTEADLPAVVEQSVDPATVRWTTVPTPYGPAEAEAFLRVVRQGWSDGSSWTWVVETEIDGRPSFAGLVDIRPRIGEIGFALHPSARGGRVMSAASRLAGGYWFSQGARRLYWTAERGNWASRRVAWACGFTDIITLPDRISARTGGMVDAWSGSLAAGQPMTPAQPWIQPVDLSCAGLRLRQWRDEDGVFVESPEHPAHFMPAEAAPTSATFDQWLMRRRENMAAGAAFNWCIADEPTDRPLGEVGVFSRSGPIGDVAELGYQVFPSARRAGVATRAAARVVDHALAPIDDGGLGLRRLVAQTAADNDASNTVLSRLGFTRFGVERAVELLPDGSYADAYHFDVLR